MPSFPTVVMIGFAVWLAIYIGWLLRSPGYRREEGAAYRRLGEPTARNFVTFAAATVVGVLWTVEWLRYGIEWAQMFNVAVGIAGIAGLAVITRKRMRP